MLFVAVIPEAEPVSGPNQRPDNPDSGRRRARGREARTSAFGRHAHLLGLAGTILLLGAVLSALAPNFLTVSNIRNILDAQAITLVFAVGITVVMLAGGADLSFASVAALAGVSAALLLDSGQPLWIAVAGAMAVGTCCGLFNAFAILRLHVNPIVATLGTLFAYRGLAVLITGGFPVPVRDPILVTIGTQRVFDIPITALIALFIAVAVAATMRFLQIGRHIRAVGFDTSAAARSGIRAARLRLVTYVFSAAMSTVGGLLLLGYLGTGFAQVGEGTEFATVGAVVIGGTALVGRSIGGGVVGTILGVVLVGMLLNGLNLLGYPPFYQILAQGLLLISAIALNDIRARKVRLL